VLPLSPVEQATNFVLQLPDGSALRQPLTPGQTDLSIASTEMVGNYRLRAGPRQEQLDRGFSVNVPPELSRLERASAEEIVALLGKERARVARSRSEIEVRVGLARRGRELFPTLILVLALVLAVESLLANRFYRAPVGGESKTESASPVEEFRSHDANPLSSIPISKSEIRSSQPVGAGASEPHS
jgi:hypothetical protein